MASLVASQEWSINTTTNDHQQQPSVAVLSDGTRLVTWASAGQDGDGFGVYARRLSADGTPLTGEFRVNGMTADTQERPSVAPLANGGFMIAWHQIDRFGKPAGVFTQVYDAAGVADDMQGVLSAGSGSYPKLTALADGSVMAVWNNQNTVYAQRYDADGAPLTRVSQVWKGANGEAVQWPNIAALSDGRYLVTWSSQDRYVAGNTYDIFAQRYDVAGRTTGSTFSVGQYVAGHHDMPTLTALPDGGFLAAWVGPDAWGGGVKLRAFTASGQAPVFTATIATWVWVEASRPLPCCVRGMRRATPGRPPACRASSATR